MAQLGRPGRDPREDLPAPVFKHGVLKLEDLNSGKLSRQTLDISVPVVDIAARSSDPVDPETARDEPEIVAEAMQRYADRIEAHVRAYPDHISKV